MANEFFDEMTEQSRIKAEIVAKYFAGWASIILSQVRQRPEGKLAYIDLYAGPGHYKDGTESTPLRVLKHAISHPELQQRLVTAFNDANAECVRSLQTAAQALPGIDQLQHPPRFMNTEVDRGIADRLAGMRLVPTLLFVDPWGYKGVSLALLRGVLKDWGCDCMLFFNYNRINAALGNPAFESHMVDLWSRDGLDRLRERLEGVASQEREGIVIDHYRHILRQHGMPQVVTFAFESETRLSHHLVLISKHPKAEELVKEIMAPYSSRLPQHVPTLRYSPDEMRSPALFEMSRPLDNLMDMLWDCFAGRTLTAEQVYLQHHEGRPFIRRNYKEALLALDAEGRVVTDPPAQKRRRNTMADHVKVTFRRREA